MTVNAADRFNGRAKRVTITLPEDLEEAVKAEIGEREFSSYVTESIARRYQLDQLARLLDTMDDETGEVSDEIRVEVASWWPDESARHTRGAA